MPDVTVTHYCNVSLCHFESLVRWGEACWIDGCQPAIDEDNPDSLFCF